MTTPSDSPQYPRPAAHSPVPAAREPEFFVDATGRSTPERRKNPVLRELLDELLTHVRTLSRESPQLPTDDLRRTRERVEWLADEIWDAATHVEE